MMRSFGMFGAALLIGCGPPGVGSRAQLGPARALEEGLLTQFRSDPMHTGRAPPGTTVGRSLTLTWKSEPLAIGSYSASKSSPAVDEDVVYLGNDDGRLFALSRETGEVLWAFETRKYEKELKREDDKHRGIHGTPAFDEERVYIGDYDGWLYAIDKRRGYLIWEMELGGSIGASPALHSGLVFMAVEYGDPDGKVFVLNAEDGEVLYETPYLGNHPHSSATVDPERGLFFVGANNGLFFGFDFVRGEELWRYQTGADIKSTAAVSGDLVYITSWDRKLHALDVETGSLRFEVETDSFSMSSPALDDGAVYFGSHDARLYKADAHSGELAWTFGTRGAIQSSPILVEDTGVVFVGSRDHQIYGIDAEAGTEVWRYRLDADVTSVPVATGSSLFVNDDSGTLWRFDASED